MLTLGIGISAPKEPECLPLNAIQVSDTCLQVNVGEAVEAIKCLEVDKPRLEDKLGTIMRFHDKQIDLLENRIDEEIAQNKKLSNLLQDSIENQQTAWYEHPVFWFTVGAVLTTVLSLSVQ